MPNYFTLRFTEGFGWAKSDENGYFNTYFNDFQSLENDINILLMGSSHMEGGNVKPFENAAYLINQNLQSIDFSLYNIAISGHSFIRCIKNLDTAIEVFNPSDYVVIETNSILLSESEVNKVIDGTMDSIPSYDSGPLFYLQKILYLKLIYAQINGSDNENAANTVKNEQHLSTSKQVSIDEDEYYRLMKYAADIAKNHGVKLIIFYHPSLILNDDGTADTSTNLNALSVFLSACEENNILFIDMTQAFLTMYENDHVLPHGFINTAVGQGHMNKYGHDAVAQAISQAILEMESEA